MGYYTYHKVSCDKPGILEEAINKLVARTGYSTDDFDSADGIKWYSETDDMQELSLMYPGVTFRVDGDGEESCDIWVHWYRDGEMREWKLDYSIPDGFVPPEGW